MIESQRKKLNNPNSLRIVISGMTFCEYGNVNKNFWSAYGNMCCGATGVYDNNVAKCCNSEKLVPKSSFCGSVRYDQCTHLCCNEYLHPKIEGITSCCGKNSYNVKTHICCNERPEPKYKCFAQWYYRKYYIKREAECGSRGVFYRPNSHESCPGKFTFLILPLDRYSLYRYS